MVDLVKRRNDLKGEGRAKQRVTFCCYTKINTLLYMEVRKAEMFEEIQCVRLVFNLLQSEEGLRICGEIMETVTYKVKLFYVTIDIFSQSILLSVPQKV